MANEAVPVIGPYVTRDWTCAAGNSIEKGTLLHYSDPLTVSGANLTAALGLTTPFAGIAAMEKSVSDGDTSTRLSVIETGVFDILAHPGPTANIVPGSKLVLSGQNVVTLLSGSTFFTSANNLSAIVGTSLESVSSATAEVIQVDIGNR